MPFPQLFVSGGKSEWSSAFLRLLIFLLTVLILACDCASLVAQRAKNLPAVQETQVQFLGQEDPLEKGMATHSSILGLENSVDRGAWWAAVHRVTESNMTGRLTLKKSGYM